MLVVRFYEQRNNERGVYEDQYRRFPGRWELPTMASDSNRGSNSRKLSHHFAHLSEHPAKIPLVVHMGHSPCRPIPPAFRWSACLKALNLKHL